MEIATSNFDDIPLTKAGEISVYSKNENDFTISLDYGSAKSVFEKLLLSNYLNNTNRSDKNELILLYSIYSKLLFDITNNIGINDVIDLNNNLRRTYSINRIISEKLADNFDANKYKALKKEFETELNSYKSYLKTSTGDAICKFDEVAKPISKINFLDSTVELSPANSFKITLLLPDNLFLVITKPLSQVDDLYDDEVVFNIYRENKCLISDSKNINELAEGINDYLSDK